MVVKALGIAFLMLAGFFLAMFAHPAGWAIVFIGLIWLLFAMFRANAKAKATEIADEHSHTTAPENRDRGPSRPV